MTPLRHCYHNGLIKLWFMNCLEFKMEESIWVWYPTLAQISPYVISVIFCICLVLMLTRSKEITLTPSTDPFFAAHSLATFGDLGTVLKTYVQSYQSRSLSQGPSSINSISDMKRFVEEYPEFRRLGGNVSKHVALVGELSRIVGRDKLLEVGEVEQGLATSSGADFRVIVYFSQQHKAFI